ncbi:LytTR family DNA-binding domain-containing protein [uncultured Tenacibaculum sp.]|uniref:LytR/AlgR family response regulator transcription factor n=1 Tax=uncultured Tenacibaculum sp. TaxID=174713 RepID=UPI0026218043|nr:LytTR family DNA-binding domain-containing protein [uncultured Tenacibaculum sp.]
MIKTIIIDDEHNAREFLEKLLNRYLPNEFLVLDKCESVDKAIVSIEKNEPELIFLDVEMPNKNGFELLKEMKSRSFDVIFTTAYSEYAIKAIKENALDYLLKPINYIDLLETIKRYKQRLENDTKQDNLRIILNQIDSGDSNFNKIALPTESGYEIINPNQILYCQADSNYSSVTFINGKKIILSKTLKYIEELLPKTSFHRIHKSYLVNLNHIVRFNKSVDLYVELNNGEQLPLASRKKESFLNAILPKK